MTTKKEFQIGWYIVPEDIEMTDHGFACAAWSQTIAIKAGKYPIMSTDYFYHERDRRYTDDLADRSISIRLEGPILRDNFQSHFCGNPIGTYDTKQNAGKLGSITLSPYAHAMAWDIIHGDKKVKLFSRYEPRITEFEYNGETHQTASIFDREKAGATT